MILPQTTNCRRLGKNCGISGVKDRIAVLDLLSIKISFECVQPLLNHTNFQCAEHGVPQFSCRVGEQQAFTRDFLDPSIYQHQCCVVSVGRDSECWFCDHLFNVNCGYNCQDAWKCWCGKTRLHAFQRCTQMPKMWLKALGHIREILFKLKKNYMCLTGLLFEGSKRQIHSKSRISGLLARSPVVLRAGNFFTFCSLKEQYLVFWC